MAYFAVPTTVICGIIFIFLSIVVQGSPPVSEECGPETCKNGGLCGNDTCYCLPGYTGPSCEDDSSSSSSSDPCDDEECEDPKVCVHRAGTAYCVWCEEGTSGDNCTRVLPLCLTHGHQLCAEGVKCLDVAVRTARCTCPPGRTGQSCETALAAAPGEDPCDPNLCQPGGSCTKNGTESYECMCAAGRTGKNCETEVNPCDPNPCQSNGTCTQNGTTGYTCTCTAGTTGTDCETVVDPCESNPCQNNGTCTKRGMRSYTCDCPDKRTGKNCETFVNPCMRNPCQAGGTCINNLNGTFTCTCKRRRSGDRCQHNVLNDPGNCPDAPCADGLRCVTNGMGDRECLQVKDGPCTVNPCRNNATCTETTSGLYICTCREGYHGGQCHFENTHCVEGICSNGGTCTEKPGKYNCECKEPFRGKRCERAPRSLVFIVKLRKECKNEYLNNITTLRTMTSDLTGKITERLCRRRNCTSLQVIGASCGSVNVHYKLEVESADSVMEVKGEVGQLADSTELQDEGVIAMPDIIVAYEDTGVNRISPSWGPSEGGTNVTISGFGLNDDPAMVVKIGELDCPIISRSPVELICQTSPLTDPSLLRTPLTLRIGVTGQNLTEQTGVEFTYRALPTIDSIYPLRTIMGGGVRITVNGTDLDTSNTPKLLISVNGLDFSEECLTSNKTLIVCATPEIKLEERRRKRDVRSLPERRKRDTDFPGRIENETFMISINLDGIIVSYPEEIAVYNDPTVFLYNITDHGKSTIKYKSYSSDYIEIEGEGLRNGLTAKDYTILIGENGRIACPIQALSDTRIRCSPGEGSGTHPIQVQVGTGNIDVLIGFIKYENSPWENPGFMAGVVSGIIVVLIILICAAFFCIFNHIQQKRQDEALKKHNERSIVRNFNSKYDKRRNRSLKKRISDFISTPSTRIFKQPKDIMSIQNPQLQHQNSSESDFPSYASTIEVMPNNGRYAPNYNQDDPDPVYKSFFLRHFSKFVSNRRSRPSPDEGIYNEIRLSTLSFDEGNFAVGITAKDAEMMRRCSRDHLLAGGETLLSQSGQMDMYLQPTSGSIHPPASTDNQVVHLDKEGQ